MFAEKLMLCRVLFAPLLNFKIYHGLVKNLRSGTTVKEFC